MEDNLSFLNWIAALRHDAEDLDIPELAVMRLPEGAVKTGIFLDDDQKAHLAMLKVQIDIAKDLWLKYEKLTPSDQKVKPFLELCVQCKRCKILSDTADLLLWTLVPANFYQFNGIGIDENFQIWVGPQLVRNLSDLVNPATMYPPKRFWVGSLKKARGAMRLGL